MALESTINSCRSGESTSANPAITGFGIDGRNHPVLGDTSHDPEHPTLVLDEMLARSGGFATSDEISCPYPSPLAPTGVRSTTAISPGAPATVNTPAHSVGRLSGERSVGALTLPSSRQRRLSRKTTAKCFPSVFEAHCKVRWRGRAVAPFEHVSPAPARVARRIVVVIGPNRSGLDPVMRIGVKRHQLRAGGARRAGTWRNMLLVIYADQRDLWGNVRT